MSTEVDRISESGVYDAIARKNQKYPYTSFTFFGKIVGERLKAIHSKLQKRRVQVLEVGSNDGQFIEVMNKHAPSVAVEYLGIDVSSEAVAAGNQRLQAADQSDHAHLLENSVLEPSEFVKEFASAADFFLSIYVAPSIGFEPLVKALDELMQEGSTLLLIDRIYTKDKADGMKWHEFLPFFVDYCRYHFSNKIQLPLKDLLAMRGTIYESEEYQAELERHQANASGTKEEVLAVLSKTFAGKVNIGYIGDTLIAIIEK